MQNVASLNLNPNNSAEAVKAKPYPWILSPALDYLLCCGGMMWLLAAVEHFGVQPVGTSYPSVLLAGVLFWGSLLLSEAHGPATLVRVFKSRTTPRYVRVLVIVWGAVLIAAGTVAMQNLVVAQIMTKITLVWLVQHYIAQTFGVVLIYCMKRQFVLSKLERGLIQWLLRSLMFFVIFRMFTVPAFGHLKNFLGMEVPFYGPLPFWPMYLSFVGLVFCTIGFGAAMIWRYIRTKEIFPLPAVVTIISVAALTMSQRDAFFLLGITFYHASQYLAITYSYFLKEKALEEGRTLQGNFLKEFLRAHSFGYYFVLILAGFLITMGLPQGLIKNGIPQEVCLCVLYSCFNCHHYLTDAFLWRVRNKDVRELLV
jgi:hypothetical protein